MAKGTILIVDDEPRQRQLLADILGLEGYQTLTAGGAKEALQHVREAHVDVIISDMRMPDMNGLELFKHVAAEGCTAPFIIITAFATVQSAVEAMQQGVYHYVTKPVNAQEVLRVVERAVELRHLREENVRLRQELQQESRERIIGVSKQMRALLDTAERVAPSDATVLITGESGTGKEMLANFIHYHSPRATGPFIRVNCAAIPENLLESELFGHEKGAYTGAIARRKGRFERAHGGSLLLDEIGEMPLHLQAKLLRVLQEGEIERLGGSETIPVDVRIIATTNQDMEEAVREGQFREDLFFRISVVLLRVSPLRERKSDIPVLATHFLRLFCEKNNRDLEGFSAEAMKKLEAHKWPGNVRELRNCIERAVLLARGNKIMAEDLVFHALDAPSTSAVSLIDLVFENEMTLDDLERKVIEESLRRAGWNQTQAAKMIGLSRRTLQYRMEKYGLRPKPE